MRRKLALIFGFPLFIALVLTYIYWRHFRGSWPEALNPTDRIEEQIE